MIDPLTGVLAALWLVTIIITFGVGRNEGRREVLLTLQLVAEWLLESEPDSAKRLSDIIVALRGAYSRPNHE